MEVQQPTVHFWTRDDKPTLGALVARLQKANRRVIQVVITEYTGSEHIKRATEAFIITG